METYFAYFGMAVAGAALLCGAGFLALVAIVCWQEHGPEFHCRRPRSRMILSTFRRDITDGEGRPIKCAPDIKVAKMIGTSWKLKFFFGLMLFTKSDG